MLHLQGRIRDYNPTTDTCSLELDGLGSIETWLDGVAIDPAVSRAYCYHGGRVSVAVHDPHRLDEAMVVGIADKPTTALRYNGSNKQTTKTGRGYVSTDGTGSGSTAVTYSPAYTAAPTDVRAIFDNGVTFTLSSLLSTGFTVTVTNQSAYANSYVYFTWEAIGA